MKRLLLILCVLGFANLSQAQTPTKQQTVNELNNQKWKVEYRNYYDSYTRGVTRGHYQTM
ncbi:hypothetical protein HMPREF2660_09100 [Weeksella sp. HMSC059D05]|nr:hypothetical protein HMPREF2660_09100 [Weeksella sp. HMSC059D05]